MSLYHSVEFVRAETEYRTGRFALTAPRPERRRVRRAMPMPLARHRWPARRGTAGLDRAA